MISSKKKIFISGKNNVAKLIVQANDSPYGVVLWERESVTLPEPDGTDLTQEVYITRQQGMMGQLQVSFQYVYIVTVHLKKIMLRESMTF